MSEAKETMKKQKPLAALLESAPAFAGDTFSWLAAERTRARAAFESRGLPTRRDEQWKYTSVSALGELSVAKAPGTVPIDMVSRQEGASVELVFVNGHFRPDLSRRGQITGLSAMSLAEAMTARDSSLRSDLERAAIFTSDAYVSRETSFAALNTASFDDAFILRIAADTKIEGPIVVTFVSTEWSTGVETLPASQPRVLAIFGRRSDASVIERHVSFGASPRFVNAVTEGVLLDGARATFAAIQEGNESTWHIGSARFHLLRDSRLETLQVSLGGKLTRRDLIVRLAAPGAEAVVDGLYLATGSEHVDNHTSIEHAVGDTTSEQVYKGILDGRARAVFNGRVWIAQDAQKANSSQLNNNLLLSQAAEIDTKPELEIFADDVKAAHGATVGRLDPEHVFYLKSRAIPEADAQRMLSEGFALDVVYRRTNEALRAIVAKTVSEHLRLMRSEPK